MSSASPVLTDSTMPDSAAAAATATVSTPPSTPPAQQEQQQEEQQQDDDDDDDDESAEAVPYIVQVHHEPEEVAQRLFAAPELPDIAKEVSGLWGWVSSGSQSLVSKATELAEEAAKQAEELRKAALETAGEQRTIFESEKDRFMATPDTLVEDDDVTNVVFGRRGSTSALTEAAETAAASSGPLPWLPESEYTEAIKTQVLRLSEEDNTFLVPPPEEVDFSFDFDASAGLALALLEVDSNLSGKRFTLVPRQVKETEFWKHYFYRVHLIQEAYGHTLSFAPDGGSAAHSGGSNENSGGASDTRSSTGGEEVGSPGGALHSDHDQQGQGHGRDDDDERRALEAGAKGHEMTRSSHVEGEFHAQDAGNDKTQDADGQDAGIGSADWEDELRAELDFDEDNFDMVDMDDDDDDNDGIVGVNDGMDDDGDEDDDDALALEERIRAELDMEGEDSF